MSKTSARLSINVYVECPSCEATIDLMDMSDTDGHDHNEGNDILKQACPIDGRHWSEAHEDFEIEDVTCTECKHEFTVKTLEWEV